MSAVITAEEISNLSVFPHFLNIRLLVVSFAIKLQFIQGIQGVFYCSLGIDSNDVNSHMMALTRGWQKEWAEVEVQCVIYDVVRIFSRYKSRYSSEGVYVHCK